MQDRDPPGEDGISTRYRPPLARSNLTLWRAVVALVCRYPRSVLFSQTRLLIECTRQIGLVHSGVGGEGPMRTFWIALPLVFSVFPSYAEVNYHGGENINITQPCVSDWVNVMETIDGRNSVVNLCSTIGVKILGDINGGSRVSIHAGDQGVLIAGMIDGSNTKVTINTSGPVVIQGKVDNVTSRLDIEDSASIQIIGKIDGGPSDWRILKSRGNVDIAEVGDRIVLLTCIGHDPTTPHRGNDAVFEPVPCGW